MSLEYTAAKDLVDTVIAMGTMAFWSVKALTVLWLQEYNTILFMIGFKCQWKWSLPSLVLAD